MRNRAKAGAGVLLVGCLVTMLCVAQASGSEPTRAEETPTPWVQCLLDDGGPCVDAAVDDAHTDAHADAHTDGGTDAEPEAGEGDASVDEDAAIPDDAAAPADATVEDAAPGGSTDGGATIDGGESNAPGGSSGDSGGCGCDVVRSDRSVTGLFFFGVALAMTAARRARRR